MLIDAKLPGTVMQMQPVRMDFDYSSSFGAEPPDAYERLVHDVMVGDQTLFTRGDEVEAEWRVVTPVLQAWDNTPATGFPNFDAGTWGPAEADSLPAHYGARWRRL